MTIKDSNVTIMVKDMDKSVSFYQSIGFAVKKRWGNHYAQLTAAGITIGVHPTNDTSTGSGNISIGFTTDNFEETKDQLSSLLIYTQSREEEGGKFIHFHDPDGTMLYFIQPK
jgi:catechol 2,3-dioxygenase-like lactoylglutathione lyase family enzyme